MEIKINKCIKYIAHAQDNITSVIIKHCWTKADILPNNDDENYANAELENHNANIKLEIQRLKELKEVQVLINKLSFEDPLDANEFVQYNKSEIAREMISDEEIIKAIHLNNQENQEKEIETPLPQITYDEVIESYDKVILYLE